MNMPVHGGGRGSPSGRLTALSASFEAGEDIAQARDLARGFLTDAQEAHGLHVPDRVLGAVQLVVSELVTNARKYAPGPCLVSLRAGEGVVEVAVWDSEPCLPVAQRTDPGRIGQHGLEIVMALCRSFEMHREPVGKRIVAAVPLTDDPVGDEAGDRNC